VISLSSSIRSISCKKRGTKVKNLHALWLSLASSSLPFIFLGSFSCLSDYNDHALAASGPYLVSMWWLQPYYLCFTKKTENRRESLRPAFIVGALPWFSFLQETRGVERHHSQNSDFHLGDLSICDFFMGFWVIFTSKFHNLTAHRAFAFFISSSRVLFLSYFPFESNSPRVRDYCSRFKSMKVWRCLLHGIKMRDQVIIPIVHQG
jgi:hypothetical protein